MQSKATTVAKYIAELPEDRRKAITAVRKAILANLDSKFEEGMQYGMIGYFVPHSVFPAGYHCDPKQPLPFAGLASQKNHMAVYLMCVYSSDGAKRFKADYAKTGKKLDMGKCCIRFKKLDDLALDVIGREIKRVSAEQYIEYYQKSIMSTSKTAVRKAAARARPRAAGRSPARKPAGRA